MDRKSLLAGAALVVVAGSVMAVEVSGSGWREVVEPTGCINLACLPTADAGTVAVTSLGSSTELAVGGKYRVVATSVAYVGKGNLPDGGVQAVSTTGIYLPAESPEQMTFGSSGGYGLQSGDNLRCYVPTGSATVQLCRIYDGVK